MSKFRVRGSPGLLISDTRQNNKKGFAQEASLASFFPSQLPQRLRSSRHGVMGNSNAFNYRVIELVVSNTLIHNLEAFEAVILQPR